MQAKRVKLRSRMALEVYAWALDAVCGLTKSFTVYAASVLVMSNHTKLTLMHECNRCP